ncbi:nitronate monooxygenase [Salinifilum ghardaiensis]
MGSADSQLVPSRLPLVAAPMAGGASTPALVSAVSAAGGFGFLAGGYKTAAALKSDMDGVRRAGFPFGVNLFVPEREPVDEAEFRRYAREIAEEGRDYGLDLAGAPVVHDDDRWQEKVDLLLREPVSAVGFTFGLPGADVVAALRRAGSHVLVTVTDLEEAAAARELGVDGIVVQGPQAGGHSAVHSAAREPSEVPLERLVADVGSGTGLPVLAAGGVAGPEDVRRLLDAGAEAVVVGTLLLRTEESGAGGAHRDALVDPSFTGTVVTRAFTGRPARALRNGFVDRHGATAPVGYPAVHHLTRELRGAAAKAHDADRVHLWAGTGHRHAPTGPAASVVAALAEGCP